MFRGLSGWVFYFQVISFYFMETIQALREGLVMSVQGIATGVGAFVPKLLGATIFIILGFIFGSAVGRVVTHVAQSARVDEWLAKAGVHRFFDRAGYKLDAALVLGWLAKAFFVIVFLVAAFDVLGLTGVNTFLQTVLAYIPRVIIAALMLFFASIAADFVSSLITGMSKAFGAHIANFLGTVARWAIWIFAIIIALSELGIAPQYMYTLFTGIVAMLALAGGLAFGLGGKETATEFIKHIRSDIREGRREA